MLSFISPPRPKRKINPRQLASVEREGRWYAQPKYDGDRCGVPVKGTEIEFFNRHGRKTSIERSLRTAFVKEIRALPLPSGLVYFDGEYLPQCEALVFYDLLFCGRPLAGASQATRSSELRKLCGSPHSFCLSGFAHLISEHLWLAPDFSDKFAEHYANALALTGKVEGLLLRRIESYLEQVGCTGEYEVDWQLRCRQPKKNYVC
jgi:hypothetical protein